MDRKDETMNLEAIKAMLSDVPDGDEFDLDSIIAEVEGGAPAQSHHVSRSEPAPSRTAQEPRPPVSEAPKAVPRVQVSELEMPEPEPPKAAPVREAASAAQAAPRTAPKKRATRKIVPEQEQIPDLSAFEEAEQDERAVRIAAREAKAAARQEKAAAKAAARQAKREAKLAAKQAAEEEDAFDDLPDAAVPETAASAKRASRGAKMTRKEARAARIAAEQAEEEEEIQLRDPQQAQRAFKRRAQGLSARSIVVLILTVAATYLSLAPSFDVLPLPIMLDAIENPWLSTSRSPDTFTLRSNSPCLANPSSM